MPAVALCRDRCNYIDEALRQSCALADAHTAYLESLKSLGPTLHRFFGQNPNPPATVGDPIKPSVPVTSPEHHSRSSSTNSDSHLRFRSDSEDDDDDTSADDKDLESSMLLHQDETQSQIRYNFTFMDSRKPPPPPSPITPTWDMFNFFDTYERFDRFYNSNSEVEAAPGTIKLDDDKKFSDNSNAKKGQRKPSDKKAEDGGTKTYKAQVVDEGGGPKEERSESEKKVSDSTAPSGTRGVSEAMIEIRVLFEKASDSGIEVLKLLDYRHRITINKGTHLNLVLGFRSSFWSYNVDF